MARVRLSDAQRCMLRCIDDYNEPGDGWAPIEVAFLEQRPPMPVQFEQAAVWRVRDALERKGLIDTSGDGPALTDSALAELMCGRTEWQDDGKVRP